MKSPVVLGKGIIVGAVRLGLPADLDHARWCEIGTNLCHLERALAWWVGDWWAFGEHRYRARREITEHLGWQGPAYQTCTNAAAVCRAFEISRRRETLSFSHHEAVAVDLVLVEDTSRATGLIQLLKEEPRLDVVGRQPDTDKVTRMSRQQGRFEAGRILLPQEALWLADFENELLAFPAGRYDDQVDALLLFLEWFAQHEQYIYPVIGCPVVIVRQTEPWPWPAARWPF